MLRDLRLRCIVGGFRDRVELQAPVRLQRSLEGALGAWLAPILAHINRDKFYNWVAKLDHNFGSKDRMFVRYGQNKRNEIRNFNAIASGPAQSAT